MTLYEQICDWGNLLWACEKASRGKRSQSPAARFEYRLEDNLFTLKEELTEKTYRPGAYTSFYIHDPKKRLISAAPFRDRVGHHALCNIIEPLLEKSFIDDSYANRIGKGTHRAIDRAQHFSRRFKYVLPCDIQQYFPAIDHDILRRILFRRIKNDGARWLIDLILKSGEGVLHDSYKMVYFPGDDLFANNRPRGLPIGNLTSQFWANCYLDGFDHFVKRELGCKGYVRYVDDMLLFDDDKKRLWEWKTALNQRLELLRLTIHENRAQVRPVREGAPFLGFVVFPNKRRLKRRKGVAYNRKLKGLVRAFEKGLISVDYLSASIAGWINHVRYADTEGLQDAIIMPKLLHILCGSGHAGHAVIHQNL